MVQKGKGRGTETDTEAGGNPAESGTDTERSNSEATRNEGRGRGRGTQGANEKEKESPIVHLVEKPELTEKEIEKRARRAEAQKLRRLEKKAATTNPTKPKTKADTTQIKAIIQVLSGLAATREGMEMWKLSEKEIDQLVAPLGNILSKYEGVNALTGEYADHIALLIACFTILFPRVMQMLAVKKNKKPKEVVKHARSNQDTGFRNNDGQQAERKATTSDGSDRRQPTTDSSSVSSELSQLIPSIGY
jgi:hypothetical protein